MEVEPKWTSIAAHPKSRTGCHTCKQRRVKCGEEKPECQRCLKLGVKCAGYTRPSKSKARGELPRALQPRPLLPLAKPEPAIQNEISLWKFESDVQQVYFNVFCTQTINRILPNSHSSVFKTALLQASVSSPAIRFAIAALGALDESALCTSTEAPVDSQPMVHIADSHHQNALRQYSFSIKFMLESSKAGNQSTRTTLLTCLVIMCFEAWNGNHTAAVKQGQTGFKLIKAWKQDQQGQSTGIEDIEESLMEYFSFLDAQLISFGSEKISAAESFAKAKETELLNAMPKSFSSFNEAIAYESHTMRRLLRLVTSEIPQQKPSDPVYAFPVSGFWGETAPSAVAEQKRTLNYLRRWFEANDFLWNEAGTAIFAESPDTTAEDWWKWRARIATGQPSSSWSFPPGENGSLEDRSLSRCLIQAQHDPRTSMIHDAFKEFATVYSHLRGAWIVLILVFTSDETFFDSYNHYFLEILELSDFILESQSLTEGTRSSKFTFDIGVIIPIFLVGFKCRERTIRRKAISLLLDFPRREGVWDSVLCGRMIEWVMNVEEEGMGKDSIVSGWSRIHKVEMERDMESRTALLSCEQRVSDSSDEMKTRRKIIKW